jgi:hypothetical protein
MWLITLVIMTMIECLLKWVNQLNINEEIILRNLILGKEKLIFGEEAFKRVRLGVVLQMTSIGIPMIWMGEEMGE